MFQTLPDILSADELARVLVLAEGGSFGDGAATAGYRARRVKRNEQLPRHDAAVREIGLHVLNALERNKLFQRHAIPRQAAPPLVSRYSPGMEYGAHIDEPLMGDPVRIRCDLALTLFLSELDAYEGGDLVIETGLGERSIRLPRNAAVLYPATTLHRVAPVTRGTRLAAVTWVQSHIRDQARRELLADVLTVAEHLNEAEPNGSETNLAYKSWSNLMRMWAEN